MKVMQHLKQGTIEWLEWRKQGLGGSDIASIFHESPWTTVLDLWLEKTGQKEAKDLSDSFIVQRGHALEPDARNYFENITKTEFPACLFEHDEFSFLKYSCDGYDDKETIIEIKCNGKKSHEMAINKQIPPYYMRQIQYGLAVSKAKSCFYISYNPEHETPMAFYEIKADPSYQKQTIQNSVDFWNNNVKGMKKPLSKAESKEINDSEIREKVEKIRELSIKHEQLGEEIEALESEVKDWLSENNIKNANCANVFFSSVERKGNVDYSSIPELKGVDLEKYRKKASTYWKIEIKD